MFVTIALIFFGISALYVLSNHERELTRRRKELKDHESPSVAVEKQLLPADSYKDPDPETDAILQNNREKHKEHETADLTSRQEEIARLGHQVEACRVALVCLVCAIVALILGLFFSIASLTRSLGLYWLVAIPALVLLSVALILLFRNATTRRKVIYGIATTTILASILAGARALARFSINPEFTLEAKIDAALNGYFNRQSALGPEHIASINSFFSGRRCPTKEEKACDSVEVQDRLTPIFDRVCRSTTEHPGPPQWVVIIGSTDRVPLRGKARATFESNFGLARARAEWIKTKWLNWKKTAHSDQTTNCQIPDENFITIGAGPRETGELLAANTKRGYSLANDDDRGIDIWALWPSVGKTPEKALDISIKVSDIDLKKKFPLPKTQFGFGAKKQKQ